jgi:hypothetical protein
MSSSSRSFGGCVGVAAILLLTALPSTVAGSVIQVGPGRTYTMPCQVSGVVVDGDTVEIDPGIYAGQACYWGANDLTLRGVGGRAWLQAPAVIPNGKAIWVIGGDNTLVENIELSDAAVPDANGAGIRQEGTNLTVRSCSFHDNQEGILTTADPASTILIEYSEFARNGAGDGFSHNMYIGNVGTFILRYCYSHLAVVGHEVKSRAAVNYIEYNRIMDEDAGTASYSIDLPNGGLAYVIGNLIEQGPLSQNSAIVTFAEEGASNPSQELYVVNNTIVNDLGRGTFVRVAGAPSASVLVNNVFWGGGTALNGTGTLTNNLAGVDPMLADEAGYDYHLLPGSPAIDAGTDPGIGAGYDLAPISQYLDPADGEPRSMSGAAIDVGAYEYSAGITLYRGSVAGFPAGWRAAAFPLSSANDDETAPFPVTGLSAPARVVDPIPSAAPLILYLALGQPGDTPIPDVLHVSKQPTGVEIRF